MARRLAMSKVRRKMHSEEAGISTAGRTVYRVLSGFPVGECSKCGSTIHWGDLFTRGAHSAPICRKCRPFKIEDKEQKPAKPPAVQAASPSAAKTGTGFDASHAVKRMAEIEADMRRVSTVDKPTMVAVVDATGETLEGAIVFIRAGGNIHDAVSLAASNGGIHNAHEPFSMAMPEGWDAEDVGLYWDFVYMG
jgi:hypothetical protein